MRARPLTALGQEPAEGSASVGADWIGIGWGGRVAEREVAAALKP